MQLDKVFLESRSITAFSKAFTAAAVAAATVAEQDIDVPDGTPALKTTDLVFVAPTATTGNATGIAGARVKDADTIAVRFVNPTAGALTPAAQTYGFLIVRE